jgi:hypothetical protein
LWTRYEQPEKFSISDLYAILMTFMKSAPYVHEFSVV